MEKSVQEMEKRALWVSIAGTAFMAAIGVGFALTTGSQAILLDGLFSGLGFFMSLATLKVASLVLQPDDEHFHFGYAHFAPLINVAKASLMLVLCVFALLSSVRALLGEGRPMDVGNAVIYGIVAALGCIVVATYLKRAAGKTGSPLVEVDASGWVVDTLMSAAVLVSFVTGYFADDLGLGAYIDYLDPAVVTLLCILALPMPLGILRRNGREVMLFAPSRKLQEAVLETVAAAMVELDVADYRLRMLKMGNTVNVLLHIKLGPDFELRKVSQLDGIRGSVDRALQEMDGRVVADLVFVDDMGLAD